MDEHRAEKNAISRRKKIEGNINGTITWRKMAIEEQLEVHRS
jgi:hypothetical protein